MTQPVGYGMLGCMECLDPSVPFGRHAVLLYNCSDHSMISLLGTSKRIEFPPPPLSIHNTDDRYNYDAASLSTRILLSQQTYSQKRILFRNGKHSIVQVARLVALTMMQAPYTFACRGTLEARRCGEGSLRISKQFHVHKVQIVNSVVGKRNLLHAFTGCQLSQNVCSPFQYFQ